MQDIEYAVGIGCWLGIAYIAIMYKFGNIPTQVSLFAPLIAICIVYIVMIVIQTLFKIVVWILKSMFNTAIVFLLVSLFLIGICSLIIRGTLDIVNEGRQQEVD